jgi:ketosteroid isomerase-like protein
MGLNPMCPVAYHHRTHSTNYRLFSILLFLLLPLASWSQNAAILANEHLRFQAQINQDTAILTHLLHDDLYYLHSNGLAESKAEFIKSVSTAKIVYQQMTPQQQYIRRYGKTALLTGLLQVSGLYEGSPFDVELYYTSVYLRKKGSWYLVSWQSTAKK